MQKSVKPSSADHRAQYPWLSVLRGIFITWIVLRHFAIQGGPASGIAKTLPTLRTFDIPTTCFFVLSGLIFSLGRTPTLSWPSVRSFWVARIGRLYPLYAAVVLACAPIGWVAAKGDLGVFAVSGLADLTFMQGWVREPHYASWLLVGWFMSSLAFCYFVYPFIAPWVLNMRAGWLVALAVCLSLYAWAMAVHWDAIATSRYSVEIIRRIPVASLPLFALGICFGALVNQGRVRLAAGLGAALAAATLYVLGALTPNGWHLFGAEPLWPLLLVAALSLKAAPPSWAIRYGEIGFTLYVLHWPLLVYSRGLLKSAGLGAHVASPLYLLALFAVLIPAAYFIYNRFERPAQEWLRRKFAPAAT